MGVSPSPEISVVEVLLHRFVGQAGRGAGFERRLSCMRLWSEPLLSAADERLLAFRIEAGVIAAQALESGSLPLPASRDELRQLRTEGELARQRFLLANTRLVWKLAQRQARRSGLEVDELFQEGFLALVGALNRFDPEVGRFSTFASIRIERHLAEVAATRCGEAGLPVGRALAIRQAKGVADRLSQELGRAAASREVAAELGLSVVATEQLLAHRGAVRLDALPAEPLQVEVDFDAAVLAGQVRRLLARLPAEQSRMLALRYGILTGEPVTQAEVALAFGLSVRTVRRVEQRALISLRALSEPSQFAEMTVA